MRSVFVFIFVQLALAFAVAAAPPPRVAPPRVENITHAYRQAEDKPGDVIRSHPGPWGDLEWSSMYLEAPDYALQMLHKPDPNPRWVFPGVTRAAIHEIFARASLPAELEQRLFATITTADDGALVLFPQDKDLESLKAETREIIYAELAKSPLNEFHRDPLIISGPVEDWLRDTRLRPALQDEIRRLVYRTGRVAVFSDIRLLLNHAQSEDEAREICRTVTRTRTLIGELKISTSSNVRQIFDYWTGGRAGSDILPLLQAATERTGGMTLDISHFLPAFARRRLYTFPSPDLLVRGRLPDCHWTSLNFFNAVTQDYYLDVRLAAQRLLENYTVVEPPYRFGDMICLLNTEGQAIHSCVYIADDVVFTKNGENNLRPWILMPLDDVKDYYSRDAADVKGFRKKPPAPPGPT